MELYSLSHCDFGGHDGRSTGGESILIIDTMDALLIRSATARDGLEVEDDQSASGKSHFSTHTHTESAEETLIK